jgi:hypothetical protein
MHEQMRKKNNQDSLAFSLSRLVQWLTGFIFLGIVSLFLHLVAVGVKECCL